jgi:ABC-type transport system substrate-binding protein
VEALPERSADGLTYTFRVKPGIYFNDDPAFDGKKRELVAEDYVYSMKRVLDPKVRATQVGELAEHIVGGEEAMAKARKSGKFDYDTPMEGLRTLDRYTFQVRINKPLYVFIYNFTDCRITCAVAREVIEKYGDDAGSHPVGTGPYRLAFWKRSSKMVLEASPGFREEYFDGNPGDDPKAQEILRMQKGKRLPMVGRIEISVIEETQPRWLSFLNEEMDMMYQVPEEFANQAMPNNRLAPNLVKRGVLMEQVPALDLTFNFFNMKDPTVGGYTPEKVALRRAISLGYKVKDEIAIVRKNQAIPASTPYSPAWPDTSPASRPRWRIQPGQGEGAARHVRLRGSRRRRLSRDARRLAAGDPPQLVADGARPADRRAVEAQHGRHRRALHGAQGEMARPAEGGARGALMTWQLGNTASAPDADTWLQALHGKKDAAAGTTRNSRIAEYDRLYEQARVLPDSPSAPSSTRRWPSSWWRTRRGRSTRTASAPTCGIRTSSAIAASSSRAPISGSTSTSTRARRGSRRARQGRLFPEDGIEKCVLHSTNPLDQKSEPLDQSVGTSNGAG